MTNQLTKSEKQEFAELTATKVMGWNYVEDTTGYGRYYTGEMPEKDNLACIKNQSMTQSSWNPHESLDQLHDVEMKLAEEWPEVYEDYIKERKMLAQPPVGEWLGLFDQQSAETRAKILLPILREVIENGERKEV